MADVHVPAAGPLFDVAAGVYDRTRRQLIWCLDAFYDTVPRLIARPPDEALSVLDLGAGTGLLAERVARAFPRARFTLLDVAERMLEVARARFAAEPAGRFRFVVGDLAAAALPAGQDVVVSALAIHHLEDAAKCALFARIHAALLPGGVFVNAEQVLGETPEIEDAYQRDWLTRARASGVPEVDLDAAIDRMRADRAVTLEQQLAWLRAAGFADVGCAFRDQRFAVYFGRR
jgi:tRNA (cmo5U34)-methyltransferase